MTVMKPDRKRYHGNNSEVSSSHQPSESSSRKMTDPSRIYLSNVPNMKVIEDCYPIFWEGLATGSKGLDMGCGPEAIAAGIFYDRGFEMIASDVEDQEETIED